MIVIDGNGVAAKAFFGTHYNAPSYNENLFYSTCIKMFINILSNLSELDNKVVICVDSPNWRKKLYPAYKANRKELKDGSFYKEYIQSFHSLCADIKQSLPIGIVKRNNYEADDLLAYFAKKESTSILVCCDRDMYQLYEPPRVQIYNFTKDQMIEINDPKLYLHIKICIGDSSDNIKPIMLRNKNNRAVMQFGEKSVPKYYDPSMPMSLDNSFWMTLNTSLEKCRKKALMDDSVVSKVTDTLELSTETLREEIEKRYEFNKTLIDLNCSPVHKEEITYSINKYDMKNVSDFFSYYTPDFWAGDFQAQRIQGIMQRFGG